MDRITWCPKCGKRMVSVVTISGRTELQCISCDDPAVKWAQSPLTAPDKPIVAEAGQPLFARRGDNELLLGHQPGDDRLRGERSLFSDKNSTSP